MILRRPATHSLALFLTIFLSNVPHTLADDGPFDCAITTDALKYDFKSLSGIHTVSRTRSTPPTSIMDTVRFDLCAELPKEDGVSEKDQCPSSTTVCLTKTNKKEGEPDRITHAIPIVTTSTMDMAYKVSDSPKGLSLTLHGPKYAEDVSQYLTLNFLCTTEASDPSFVSYNNSELILEWKTPVACGEKKNDDDTTSPGSGDDNKDESEAPGETVGSGIGWFFLVLVLAFAAYFGLGAYYNYSTYGATGKDLIPHRDFWQEVPYMLSDVVSHLCSSVRPRRSTNRGGYVSV